MCQGVGEGGGGEGGKRLWATQRTLCCPAWAPGDLPWCPAALPWSLPCGNRGGLPLLLTLSAAPLLPLQVALHGRTFGGQPIDASVFPKDRFDARDLS